MQFQIFLVVILSIFFFTNEVSSKEPSSETDSVEKILLAPHASSIMKQIYPAPAADADAKKRNSGKSGRNLNRSDQDPSCIQAPIVNTGGQPKKTKVHAKFYQQNSDDSVSCNLCPASCKLQNNETGRCLTRKNIDGRLYNTSYGNIMLMTLPKESLNSFPLITLRKSDAKVLVIGTKGCTLKCSFCATASLAQNEHADSMMKLMPPKELVAFAKKENYRHISFTISGSTNNYEYLFDVAKIAAEQDILIHLGLAGYINAKPLKELAPYISNGVLVGVKGFSDRVCKKYLGADLDSIKKTLKLLKALNVPMDITYLLIPTVSDTPEQIKDFSLFVKNNLGEYTPVHFQKFYPAYKLRNLPSTSFESIRNAMRIARNNGLKFVMPYVYLSELLGKPFELNSDMATVRCPHCGEKVIWYEWRDNSFIRHSTLQHQDAHREKRCQKCNKIIKGIDI